MKLILASNNAHKAREFREILAPLDIEVMTQSEAGCNFEADETGTTFEENAYIKAEAAMKATGLPSVSDDSGLEVDALGGEPGVHSARYTGRHEDSDADRRKYLMKKARRCGTSRGKVRLSDMLRVPERRRNPCARDLRGLHRHV